jgi:hypothetical protein
MKRKGKYLNSWVWKIVRYSSASSELGSKAQSETDAREGQVVDSTALLPGINTTGLGR